MHIRNVLLSKIPQSNPIEESFFKQNSLNESQIQIKEEPNESSQELIQKSGDLSLPAKPETDLPLRFQSLIMFDTSSSKPQKGSKLFHSQFKTGAKNTDDFKKTGSTIKKSLKPDNQSENMNNSSLHLSFLFKSHINISGNSS